MRRIATLDFDVDPPHLGGFLTVSVEHRSDAVSDSISESDVGYVEIRVFFRCNIRGAAKDDLSPVRTRDAGQNERAGFRVGETAAEKDLVTDFLHVVSHPRARQLAERLKVRCPEIVSERASDPLGVVHPAGQDPSSHDLRRHIDEHDFSGSDELVRNALDGARAAHARCVFAHGAYVGNTRGGQTRPSESRRRLNPATTRSPGSKGRKLPVVLSTVNVANGQGPTIPELREVLSDSVEIDRTQINSWEDVDFRRAVEATGGKSWS
jgi:hypothetical protein